MRINNYIISGAFEVELQRRDIDRSIA